MKTLLNSSLQRQRGFDRKTGMFIAAIIVVGLFVWTGSSVFVAIAAALGLLYIIPTEYIERLFGYLLVSDILFSTWLIGVASTTLGGFEIAVIAGLVYTIVSRELLAAWGSQRLAINGETKFGAQFAVLYRQSAKWVKAMLKGEQAEQPEPLVYEWMVHTEAGGFRATSLYRVFQF